MFVPYRMHDDNADWPARIVLHTTFSLDEVLQFTSRTRPTIPWGTAPSDCPGRAVSPEKSSRFEFGRQSAGLDELRFVYTHTNKFAGINQFDDV